MLASRLFVRRFLTVAKMREQVDKEILGQNAHVALDVVVEHEARGDGGLVLPASAAANRPARSCRSSHDAECEAEEERETGCGEAIG